jgi:hypothetical protein
MTSRRFFTVLGLVAALLALAAVFNPSAERHRDAVRAAIGERNLLAKALGLGSLAALVSSYHSLGVASYTAVDGHTLSVGVMGMVFVRDTP